MYAILDASRRPRGLISNAYIAYIVSMALLNIRKIPEAVHRRLRVRAASHGRSMEAEARAILAAACGPEPFEPEGDLQAFVAMLYGKRKPRRVVERLLAERRRAAKRE